jgi:hypothetical protein
MPRRRAQSVKRRRGKAETYKNSHFKPNSIKSKPPEL